ncbi:DUF1488 domain-containing protein [Vibrio salinus]|uniref:DUF1488 domain-containing protein n=1 Tax=Vibrio salinus TaxID=2899784 RepID=UPI001E3FE116|nr:DUF1488 domain-containing protein [Vibrio salinus]MCE0493683.1 DUF1488 domain-containing protein [Vibrio salinus]
MNQSILFPDVQCWDDQAQVVIFPAQCQGALIDCMVDRLYLERISGKVLADESSVLSAFSKFRFDIEEEAQALIEEEEFSASGKIELSG